MRTTKPSQTIKTNARDAAIQSFEPQKHMQIVSRETSDIHVISLTVLKRAIRFPGIDAVISTPAIPGQRAAGHTVSVFRFPFDKEMHEFISSDCHCCRWNWDHETNQPTPAAN